MAPLLLRRRFRGAGCHKLDCDLATSKKFMLLESFRNDLGATEGSGTGMPSLQKAIARAADMSESQCFVIQISMRKHMPGYDNDVKAICIRFE